MIRRLFIASIICCLWQISAIAQDSYSLSLNKAIELALVENRNILNAQHDIVIAKKKVWETTAIGLPQIKTESSYKNMLDIPVQLIPAKMFNPAAGDDEYMPAQFGQTHNASFDLTASQLLFSGEYIIGLQASRTYQELSQKAALKSENDVVELVTQSYYGVLLARANLDILESTRVDIQKTYDEIQKTFEVGMVDEIDVSQIELNLITVENSISSIKRQIIVAENILKYQIGIDVASQIEVTDSLEGIFENVNIQTAFSQQFDISKNIDYQLMQTQMAISELSLKREKSTLLPSLSAFYSHSTNGQTNDFSTFFSGDQEYFQSNIVGIGLSWNIFNSGGRIAKIQQAQLEVDKMENDDYLLQQGLTFQVHQARTKLINSYETYLKEEKNTVLAEKIYRRSLVKFTNGMLSSSELTQLNLQYFNSQTAFYTAIVDVLNAKAALDKILGNNI